jgi:hypothetical protein
MPPPPAEFLVLLQDGQGSVERLRQSLQVTQVASPRLAVVVAAEGALEEIEGVAEVAGAGESLQDEIALTDAERLFADAWAQRTGDVSGAERPGEGLPWDAPGFTPPDPPSGG